ncbi:hypothetical protein OG2516_15929 [Oceanicola granulosus HTCC2516]|uniref:Transcriptional regulator LacI/GalR-like sensor domain-containing protein n=2 Tax=Oceanicola granulosus TaxID=252302 RepID=Q2CAM7_OCEGH|nr:hypothetical protein OG2516_15929 [Oceanicola granulosus HTCC2516]
MSRGWSIPRDVSAVGFGDYSAARQIRPSLTTIRVHGHDIGRSIVQLLHNRLYDGGMSREPIRFQIVNEFVLRGTTGSAPMGPPASAYSTTAPLSWTIRKMRIAPPWSGSGRRWTSARRGWPKFS